MAKTEVVAELVHERASLLLNGADILVGQAVAGPDHP